MSQACTIYLVRHGESEHNVLGYASGHVDPALTERGKEQAAQTRQRLSGVKFDVVYSSDLQRAYETAEIIFGAPVPKANRRPILRERNYGRFDGGPHEHLTKSHSTDHSQMTHDEKWKFKHAEDVESDHELATRFIRGMKAIAQEQIGKTVLVVAHGGALRTLLIGLKHGTYKEYPPASIRNASFVELAYDGHRLTVVDASDTVLDSQQINQ